MEVRFAASNTSSNVRRAALSFFTHSVDPADLDCVVLVFQRTRGETLFAAARSSARSSLSGEPHRPQLRISTVGGGRSAPTTLSMVSVQLSCHAGANF